MTRNHLGLPVEPLRSVTPEERDALARDGAAVIRGVLPEAWIDPLRDAVEDLLANPDYLERGQTEDSARAMGGPMINGFMGWLHNEVFAALATHSPASEIAKQLLPGQSVQYFYDQLFVKRPGVDSGTPWHRDRNYYSIDGKDFVSIWVPFDPVLADETSVTYIKGSHLHEDVLDRSGRVLPGGRSPSGLFGDLSANPRGVETVSWDIDIGDVVVHDLNTVHMGGLGRNNSAIRRAVALRYLGDDITYNESLPGIPSLPELLGIYRARWPDLKVKDGGKFDTRAFPLVK